MSTTHQLGKYRLFAELGHGGMADVFLALVEGPAGAGFAKLAVVKRLRSNLAEDPEFIAMLIDEARITARLNHPNVVQMLEVGVENDEYFLAMEYLDGQPLHRLEKRAARAGNERIERDAYIALLVDVLAGLHHAHELVDYDGTPLTVVHRDITPHNIFLTYDGQVKVVDFGIAKAAGRAQETQHGVVKGKVRYMAPEQALGVAVDRRADLFAVGLLLWQAATGARFWGDQDDFTIVQALIAGQYEASPRAVNPSVPEELDRICRRALARSPEDRYATALEMKTDLDAFLGTAALDARRSIVALLNDLFAKERRELRAIIEKVGRAVSGTQSVAMLAQRASMSSTSLSVVAVTSESTSLSPVISDYRKSTAPKGLPSAPPGAQRGHGVIGASIAVAVAATAVAVAVITGLGGPMAGGVAAAAPAVVVPQLVPLQQTPVRTRVSSAADARARADAPIVAVAMPAAPPPAPAPPPPQPAPSAQAHPPPAAVPTIATPSAAVTARGQRGARLSIDATDPWGTKN